MALELTLRPELLAYRNTVVIEDAVIVLVIQYLIRGDLWIMSIEDEQGEAIKEGIPVITGWPLTVGVQDDRMPQGGYFMAVRIGQGDAHARAGELGEQVKLLWISQADVEEAIADLGGETQGARVVRVA